MEFLRIGVLEKVRIKWVFGLIFFELEVGKSVVLICFVWLYVIIKGIVVIIFKNDFNVIIDLLVLNLSFNYFIFILFLYNVVLLYFYYNCLYVGYWCF